MAEADADVDESTPPAAARLTWVTGDFLPPDARSELLGPGAPFELHLEPVLGTELTVFAQRPGSLRDFLDQAVARTPDLPFLVAGDRTWTFAQAAADIDGVARLLVDRYGIGPGERVGIVAANSPEYGLVMWAVASIGGIIASLNGWWTSAELAFGVELSSPSLITGDDRRLARLDDVELPAGVPVVRLDDLVAEARALGAVDRPVVAVDEDDPAVILFTSGTTGRPKGATLSHRNILHFARSIQLSAAIGGVLAPPDPSVEQRQFASILASPMFHVSGMIGMLISGPAMSAKQVFAPPGRWDETRHLELTVEHGITTWSGVPTQFWRLLRHEDFDSYDLSSLRSVGGGGAPFSPELIRTLNERIPGAVLGNGFGMSETVGLGTLAQGPILVMAPTSVGPAQAGCEVEIRDPDGHVVAEGEVGEIYLRSPSVFLGYWEDPASTVDVLDADRWYRTGDFGQISGGLLHLESRMRDLILRGGENIYPMEIEHRLAEHPDVDDVAVIGVDHEILGQEVKAFVIPRDGSELSAVDVQRWVGETLAAFKVPAHVEFRAELPYTESGKVVKAQLEADERERSSPAGTS
jgi:acyl-CoA synthetase (AMP-forming)/AMP-acid ligase II